MEKIEKVNDDIEVLIKEIDTFSDIHRVNGVFFFNTIDAGVIKVITKRFCGKPCIFVVPMEEPISIGILGTGVYSENKLVSSLRRIVKEDIGARLIIPPNDSMEEYVVKNPMKFLDIVALDYVMMKLAPVVVDVRIFKLNNKIHWDNQFLSHSRENIETRGINIIVPTSLNQQDIGSAELFELIKEEDTVKITEQKYGKPIGSLGFTMDRDTVYFQGNKVSLSSQQFKMIRALARGYERDKNKYWSFNELARMGASSRSRDDYHVNDSFMEKIRNKLSGASGIGGTKIIERKNNKHRLA